MVKFGHLASEEVVLSLQHSKCLPMLLYLTEACPLLSRNIQSFEFTITRILQHFLDWFSCDVKECQFHFNFMPIKSVINTRTTRFLQKFTVFENSLCSLIATDASYQ